MADLNENRPGYKKTKVGWLPEEWEVSTIKKSFKLINGKAFKPTEWQNTGVPIIRIQNLNNENASYNYYDGAVEEKYHVKNGDLLFAWSGSLGVSFGVRLWNRGDAYLNQHIFRVIPKSISFSYALYLLLDVQSEIERKAHGFKSSFVHVKKSDFEKTLLPLPPLPEQRAIARILSTWDAAIDKLGQLIAKKQALKKGLMQQLLSGRVRFPEFVPPGGTRYKETKVGVVPEDWEVVKAGEIFERVSKKGQSGELLAVTQEEGVIPRSHLERRVVMPSGSTEGYKLVEPGNFIISLRSFQGGLEYSAYRGLVSPAYNIITYNPNSVSSTFFRYYFKSYCFIERLSSAVIGIRDGKQISYPDFKRQLIPLPGYKEQKAIGAFLEKADQEIKNLENQRVNLETQKKGLMQQLLTGAVRVKEGIANESFIDENS